MSGRWPQGESPGVLGEAHPAQETPRLRIAPLLNRLLSTLLLPVAAALLLDWLLGTLPWVTLAAALICIPLSSVVVGKAVLRDLERVLTIVAPAPPPEELVASIPPASGAVDAPVAPEMAAPAPPSV